MPGDIQTSREGIIERLRALRVQEVRKVAIELGVAYSASVRKTELLQKINECDATDVEVLDFVEEQENLLKVYKRGLTE